MSRSLIFMVFFSLPFFCSANSIDNEAVKKLSNEDIKKQFEEARKVAWELKVSLDYPAYNHTILFARIDKDPLENYKERLNEDKNWLAKTKDIIPKNIYVRNEWNKIFERVNGPEISYVENRYIDGTLDVHTIGSNNFKPFWFVTKAVGFNNEEIIWSFYIKPKKKEKMEIKLTPENRLDTKKLFKIYDSTLKEALENKEAEIKKEYYNINMFLNYSDSSSQYVLYTVIEQDPLKLFKNELIKMGDLSSQDKVRTIITAWNNLFSTVNGSNIYAIGKNEFAALTLPYDKEAKRWIITKGAMGSEKPLIWSLPLSDKDQTIEFIKEDNVYKDLEKSYDFIVKR